MTPKHILILIATVLLAAPFALADNDSHRLVVIGDGSNQATVKIDGNQLHVVAIDDGEVSVHEFDFSQLGEIIDEAVSAAMVGLEDAFDEDLTIHVDDDHMVHVSHGDQACAFNMQLLAHELKNTLAGIHANIDLELHGAGGVHTHREHEAHDSTAELRMELDRLKAELRSLEKELDEVR